MHIRRRSSLGLDLPLGGGVLLLLLLVAPCGVGPADGSTSESPGPGSSSGGSSGSSSSGGSSGSSSSGSYGASGSGGSSSSSGGAGSSGSGGSSSGGAPSGLAVRVEPNPLTALFSRPPSPAELADLKAFLNAQQEVIRNKGAAADGKYAVRLPTGIKQGDGRDPIRLAAFVDLVHTVANSNEFSYRF